MPQQDLINLYSGKILELASNIPLTDRLADPDATVRKRAPLCGSTVTVDIKFQDGRISDYGQDVKACALGQASSSILASHVIGCTPEEIRRVRDELSAMLKENGPVPSAPFEDLETLVPARDFKNRHDSILLSYNATLEAIESLAQS